MQRLGTMLFSLVPEALCKTRTNKKLSVYDSSIKVLPDFGQKWHHFLGMPLFGMPQAAQV
jgi:hypothetical protein